MSDGVISGKVKITEQETTGGDPYKIVVVGAIDVTSGSNVRFYNCDTNGSFTMESLDYGRFELRALQLGHDPGSCIPKEVEVTEGNSNVSGISLDLTI